MVSSRFWNFLRIFPAILESFSSKSASSKKVSKRNTLTSALKSALKSLSRMRQVALPRGAMAAVNIHQEYLELQAMLRSDTFHRHPIRKCLSLANRLLNLYTGLGAGEILRINELKLRCMATLFYYQGWS